MEDSHRADISFVMCDGEYEYENDDDKDRCICGHVCGRRRLAIVSNPYTNLNCITACDCITKVGIITKHAFLKASKLSVVAQKERQCRNFTKFANLVFKYEVLRLGFRRCCDCLCYVVNILDPKWKRRCFPCWRQINPIEKSK